MIQIISSLCISSYIKHRKSHLKIKIALLS